ncbi:hypothetical protein NOCA250027 [metagenome]|uniref:Uncharacterized protein n=1 Tax=metagenome TaxID=256318 RepID=A0A2P2C8R4_9ZZZZ
MDPNRDSRIRAAIREGRRALRARARAAQSLAEAESDVATALGAVVGEGLTLAAAIEALTLTTSVGRSPLSLSP